MGDRKIDSQVAMAPTPTYVWRVKMQHWVPNGGTFCGAAEIVDHPVGKIGLVFQKWLLGLESTTWFSFKGSDFLTDVLWYIYPADIFLEKRPRFSGFFAGYWQICQLAGV